MKNFTEFTLERVAPLMRDLRDVLGFIVVLILTITAILAIPIGIIAGGSYLAYKAGLPYNIPLAHRDSRPHHHLVLRTRRLVRVDLRLRRNLEG